MSKKSGKIRALAAGFGTSGLDPRYLAYFACFNRAEYYDAHDVLEELWLAEGKTGANYGFYKGLIQGAGAFVHLKKQYEHSEHRVHAKRLQPAGKLFSLGLRNLESYPGRHQQLDLVEVRGLFQKYLGQLAASDYTLNPWQPDRAPQIKPPAEMQTPR